MRGNDDPLIVRFNERAHAWRVTVENSFETESSLIGFGRQSDRTVVLKVVKRPGDEWNSGRMLEAFGGQGVVRVYDYVERAMLLERLEPATSLSTLVGELEYEIGASLRNPWEKAELFSSQPVIERRIKRFENALKLDADRILRWGFSQAVLSAIWSVEDGYAVPPESVPIIFAHSMGDMLGV